jgi:nickel-type superoxide dismutase maturation protease
MSSGTQLDKFDKLITVNIIGNSMAPTFYDGDFLIFECKINQKHNIGDIVLVDHPYRKNKKIVKRISKINEHGDYFLVGDNPLIHETSDSRSFGYVKEKYILAKLKDK